MQCPIDGTQLVMADRSGVEIDYCPKCRGVWLDRGELDKIIERSAAISQPEYDTRGQGDDYYDHRRDDRRRDHHDDRRDDHRHPRKHRKKSMAADLLGDIFDF
ncbi:MAG: zf-TFIIB domain-containing protein [Pseudomonadota bacterium]